MSVGPSRVGGQIVIFLTAKLNIKMITNNVLTRKMGEFDVYQRTSDGYFEASSLINQWTKFIGARSRFVSDYLRMDSTKELIEEILNLKEDPLAVSELKGEKQVVIKKKGKMTNKGRTKDEVWMHPYLFIDFAMWINSKFRLQVLKFVYDNLVNYRKRAGDAYKEMSAAVYGILPRDSFKDKIQDLARSLNIIVYGHHETMARNSHGEEKLAEELMNLETDIAKMINLGYIRNEEELRGYLHRVYDAKKKKFPF